MKKNLIAIDINKPYVFDKDEGHYVGKIFELCIGSFTISIDDSFFDDLYMQITPNEDNEQVSLGISYDFFDAESAELYCDDEDDEDDGDYCTYYMQAEEATRLINYILYDLPLDETIELEDDDEPISFMIYQDNDAKQAIIQKIANGEELSVEDIRFMSKIN